jgi:exopolysaccharide production protein ExoZ
MFDMIQCRWRRYRLPYTNDVAYHSAEPGAAAVLPRSPLTVPEIRVATRGGTVIGLQYLRGIAAMMVAYFHMVGQIPSLAGYIHSYLFGVTSLASGVDIFFVISGFIMLLTTRNSRPIEFIVRRIIRVAPLYWLLTVGVAVAASLRPALFRETVVNAKTLLLSLLFIPYQNGAQHGDVFPILVPGWSLNFEMFFYAIFAVVLLARSLTSRVLINGLVFGSLVVVHLTPLTAHNPILRFLTETRILEFWFGMLIAKYFAEHAFVATRAAVWSTVAVLGFCGLIFVPLVPILDPDSLVSRASGILCAAAVVLGIVALEQIGALGLLTPQVHRTSGTVHWLCVALLVQLGDASYSIYLSHIPLLGVCRALWLHFQLPANSLPAALMFAIVSMTVVTLGSIGVYVGFERPVTVFLHRQYKRYL